MQENSGLRNSLWGFGGDMCDAEHVLCFWEYACYLCVAPQDLNGLAFLGIKRAKTEVLNPGC